MTATLGKTRMSWKAAIATVVVMAASVAILFLLSPILACVLALFLVHFLHQHLIEWSVGRPLEWVLVKALKAKGYTWIRMEEATAFLPMIDAIDFFPLKEVVEREPDYIDGDTAALIGVLKRLGYDKTRLLGSADERVANRFALLVLGGMAFGFALFLAAAFGGWRLFWVSLKVSAVVLVFFLAYGFVQSLSLRDSLRKKGYWWADLRVVKYLLQNLGSEAFNLPPRDELCTLPTYRDGDASTIVRLAVQRIDH